MENNQIQQGKPQSLTKAQSSNQKTPHSMINLNIFYNDVLYHWSVNFMELNFNRAIVIYFVSENPSKIPY